MIRHQSSSLGLMLKERKMSTTSGGEGKAKECISSLYDVEEDIEKGSEILHSALKGILERIIEKRTELHLLGTEATPT